MDDRVDESNPVRVIDAFVDALDIAELEFERVEPAARARGRPQSRADVASWPVSDHKTVADFRKDNGRAIRKVCARFAELCREMGLLAKCERCDRRQQPKAVNNRDRNFTRAKVERRRAQLDESVARYPSQLDTADRHEPTEALATKTERLKEKLAKLKEEMTKLATLSKNAVSLSEHSRRFLRGRWRLRHAQAQMLASPDQPVSLTDPDSRSMATSGRGSGVVGYNVQVAVDTEHHLVVAH